MLAHLGISVASGLAGEAVKRWLQTFGPNVVVLRRKAGAPAVLLHPFRSPVIYRLGAAAD